MITVNIDKAKTIAHEIRRAKREEEFKPFDEVIMKQIPGVAFATAEAERQAIRDKYAEVQATIDEATHIDHLTEVVNSLPK